MSEANTLSPWVEPEGTVNPYQFPQGNDSDFPARYGRAFPLLEEGGQGEVTLDSIRHSVANTFLRWAAAGRAYFLFYVTREHLFSAKEGGCRQAIFLTFIREHLIPATNQTVSATTAGAPSRFKSPPFVPY